MSRPEKVIYKTLPVGGMFVKEVGTLQPHLVRVQGCCQDCVGLLDSSGLSRTVGCGRRQPLYPQGPHSKSRARVKHILQAQVTLIFYGYLLIAILLVLLALFRWEIIDVTLFVTLWVAEVPIPVFLRYILSEERLDRPKLEFGGEQDIFKKANALHHRLVVRNRGRVGAQSCEGRITLDIKSQDIVDIPDAIITVQSFRPIENDKLNREILRLIRSKNFVLAQPDFGVLVM